MTEWRIVPPSKQCSKYQLRHYHNDIDCYAYSSNTMNGRCINCGEEMPDFFKLMKGLDIAI